jgi:hypothetical protein
MLFSNIYKQQKFFFLIKLSIANDDILYTFQVPSI